MNTILTSQSGHGPVTALDASTIPPELTLRLLHAARHLEIHIGGGLIGPDDDCSVATESIDEFMAVMKEVDRLHAPAVPGAEQFGGFLPDRYPVIRDGKVVSVPRESMTELEIEATLTRLRIEANGQLRHADTLALSAREAAFARGDM